MIATLKSLTIYFDAVWLRNVQFIKLVHWNLEKILNQQIMKYLVIIHGERQHCKLVYWTYKISTQINE